VRSYIYAAGLAAFALSLAAGSTIALQPRWLVRLLAATSPEVLYFVDTDEPIVALTIDDGPDRATTPEILRVLAANDAHATFFLISDHVAGNEYISSGILELGHEIGNHMASDEPSVRLAPRELERSLSEADGVLSRFAPLRWLRPGSGWYNEAMLSIADANGYRVALGSIYPFDSQIPSARFAAWRILSSVYPGAIVVLHDGGERGRRTVEILHEVLPVLRERGFRVVTLSEAWNHR
jgi:peptidoglycan/xylan/chitin deacetylase (PgdA/CDA1 family)